jgi:hypothetical protein
MSEVVVDMDPLIEKVTQRITKRCEYHGLESYSLIAYITHGLPPGGFLTAVLEDKLVEAASRADDFNKHHLYEWASVMYNDVPLPARGSRENVTKWLRHRGLRGLKGGEPT